MTKVVHVAIAAAASVLLLAGCSAVSAEAQGVPTPTPSVTPSSTPEPIAAKAESPSPSPSHNPDWGDYTQDEFYLAGAGRGWQGIRPTDQELIAAAHLACETLRSGTPRADVHVADGPDINNLRTVTYAIQVYCPEFTD